MLKSEREAMNSSGWFLDSANLAEIARWQSVIGGVTTNQIILFKREGVFDVPACIKKICNLLGENIPVSVQLPTSQASEEEMIKLAAQYRDLSPTNIVVKVPIIPDDPKGLRIVARLSKLGIRTNATLGINEAQLILAAEASRAYVGEGSTYISLLWGRALENQKNGEGRGPEEVLTATLNYLDRHSLSTRVMIGSIRSPDQVIRAFELGADIVAVPPAILNKIMITTRAKETVTEFDQAFLDIKDDPRLRLI